jgi:putative ABC transport system substrate-binding protein
MKRRGFITLLGGAASVPLAAWAQRPSGRVYRVGFLLISSRDQVLRQTSAFEDGIRNLGYRIGEDVVIDYRFADGKMDRLPMLAADLVRLGVDIIVTGSDPNTVAAMKATPTIPIVMTNSVDPVSAGLVAGLARPGGNVTGFSADTGSDVLGKRLELMKETVPRLSRVGVLSNPDFAPNRDRLSSMMEAARTLGLTLVPVEARGLDALEKAFATMVGEQMEAFLLMADAVLFNYRQQIGGMAIRNRLPAASNLREFAEAGFLLTYGVDVRDLFRRSAAFVDKIFKGVKPADLPVQQPTKFELVVNLKTAQALNLTLPASLLARADEVIE